ncbi:MAG: hypothetical protein U0401_30730 [Anaerolineae bacterium]
MTRRGGGIPVRQHEAAFTSSGRGALENKLGQHAPGRFTGLALLPAIAACGGNTRIELGLQAFGLGLDAGNSGQVSFASDDLF